MYSVVWFSLCYQDLVAVVTETGKVTRIGGLLKEEAVSVGRFIC